MSCENLKDLLFEWLERAKKSQQAHRAASKEFNRRHIVIGVLSVILSTFVGTAVFATLSQQVNLYMQIFVGFLSVLAAVLSALNTFLRYEEISNRHAVAASKYSSIYRQLEYCIASNFENATDEEIQSIRNRFDDLASDSPNVPEKFRK